MGLNMNHFNTQGAFPADMDTDSDGMTITDYFAAKAMQAIITNNTFLDAMHFAANTHQEDVESMVANTAYEYALAMVKVKNDGSI